MASTSRVLRGAKRASRGRARAAHSHLVLALASWLVGSGCQPLVDAVGLRRALPLQGKMSREDGSAMPTQATGSVGTTTSSTGPNVPGATQARRRVHHLLQGHSRTGEQGCKGSLMARLPRGPRQQQVRMLSSRQPSRTWERSRAKPGTWISTTLWSWGIVRVAVGCVTIFAFCGRRETPIFRNSGCSAECGA